MSERSEGRSRGGRPRIGAPVVALSVLAFVSATVWRAGRGHEGPVAARDREPRAAAADSFADAAVPVEVDTVLRAGLVLEVAATGQVEAARRAKVGARVPGRIVALPVDENAAVARGSTLAELEAREYALAVETAEAELEEARVRYREITLFDERIEDVSVREERARVARARSGLERAEIALRKARLDLESTTVAAPFAGRVADVRVATGEFVSRGQELLTIVDLDPIRVEVAVPESEVRSLREGAEATVRLSAFPDEARRGRIASVNPVVDPESRTARVTVEMPNPGAEVLPGMYARVTLEGPVLENRVTVPREAIVERDRRSLVFVFRPVEPGAEVGHAKWVYVTTGLSNAERIEILESDAVDGLEPGSLVLTGGHETLVHDASVRITGADP